MTDCKATCPECNNTDHFPASEIDDAGEMIAYAGDGEWAIFAQCRKCNAMATMILSTETIPVRQL